MCVYVANAFKRTVNCFLMHFWILLIIVCLALIQVLAHDDVGETIPHHVEIEIGGDVEIICRMNISHFNENNSSCLTFSKDYSNTTIPKEQIRILNETSIAFMIRNATEQSTRYVCKCNMSGVDATNVDVGTLPTNVTDFRCRGYDFSYITCNFTVPENKIYTHYKLKFTINSPDYTYDCNLENGALPSERICNISLDNKTYRIVYQYYNFKLIANNSLGTLTQSISIDQYASMVPARPAVEVGNITTNSVFLSWVVAKFSQYGSTNGLLYEIRLRPEKFDWININTNTSVKTNNKDNSIEIKNLEYAYRRYDIIVRAKAERASNDGTMWSEPFYGSFVTRSRRPDNPPAIDVGSFYIDPTEKNLRLYWQQLPEYRENGPEFQYNITEVQRDGVVVGILPTQIDHTSATFEWKSTSHYVFKVKSQNKEGQSLESSVFKIPPSRERSIQLEHIQMITKVYHNQTYNISWRQPTDMENLIDFTVFWCISKMESQSQCKGTINFKHFDKYTYNYNTEPQNHTLNFAVSANYRTYSTGMIWAMCTAEFATDLTKMDPETTPISSNSIKVQWSTECLYTAILEGYNLTYCKVENNVSEMIGDCINTETTVSISKRAKEYLITALEPFTTYKIWILMYSQAKVGPMSNPVLATTTEDAPTPPRNLKSYNVTSNSAVISWLPPKRSNGNLRSYTIWQNSDHHIVNSTTNDTESEITFKLENLSSYFTYKVYVTAHTVESSAPSNDIQISTLIGIPSPPRSLYITKNEKSIILRWSRPIVPSGRVEFYEISVNVWKDNKTELNKISHVVGNVCTMNIPPCYDKRNAYSFDVRAVNVAKKSEADSHIRAKRDTSFYSTIHQGAVKRRRHSNAEINSSIGAAYLIHDTSERHLRHRHERENLKTTSASTTEFPKDRESISSTPISYEISNDMNDDSDENLMCLGSQEVTSEFLKRSNDPDEYKLFYSGWENGSYYACGEAELSKITMLALAGVVISMLMSGMVCFARKKYNKMSSIGVVIPEGLNENIHMPKDVDNSIERHEVIRTDEPFYDKESHSLLSKSGNDSGFLNSVQCLDKNSAYVCSDHQDSEKSSQSTDSVELNDITSCSYTSSPSHSPNANIRETVKPEETFTSSAVMQPTSVQLRPAGNGYIKPMMMTGGYVQPQAFQKPPSFNGYTTLDAKGKLIFPSDSAAAAAPIGDSSLGLSYTKIVNNKDIVTPPQPMNGNICGYVTHKQLSDFGQRLQ